MPHGVPRVRELPGQASGQARARGHARGQGGPGQGCPGQRLSGPLAAGDRLSRLRGRGSPLIMIAESERQFDQLSRIIRPAACQAIGSDFSVV